MRKIKELLKERQRNNLLDYKGENWGKIRDWRQKPKLGKGEKKCSNLNLIVWEKSVRVRSGWREKPKWNKTLFLIFLLFIYLFVALSHRIQSHIERDDDRIQHTTNNSDICGPPQSPSSQTNGSLCYVI